jgi:hypothetical protein
MTYPGGFDEAVEVDGTVYTVGSVSITNTRVAFIVAALKGDASFVRTYTFDGTIGEQSTRTGFGILLEGSSLRVH